MTVYAVDLPGHGQSAKTIANPDLASLTEAVTGFMETLDLKDAHFVGHSLGGAIAMEIAAGQPKRVKSLTLICSAGLGPEIGNYVADYVAAQGRKDLKPVFETLFADKNQVSRQMVDDVLKYKRLDGVDAFLKALSQTVFGGGQQQINIAAKLAGKLPPTLVIWGREDQVIPSTHAASLPDAKVHIIEGAGHMVFMEKASEVNALIRTHIAGG